MISVNHMTWWVGQSVSLLSGRTKWEWLIFKPLQMQIRLVENIGFTSKHRPIIDLSKWRREIYGCTSTKYTTICINTNNEHSLCTTAMAVFTSTIFLVYTLGGFSQSVTRKTNRLVALQAPANDVWRSIAPFQLPIAPLPFEYFTCAL